MSSRALIAMILVGGLTRFFGLPWILQLEICLGDNRWPVSAASLNRSCVEGDLQRALGTVPYSIVL